MIPKVIHYCWFGGKPLPNDVNACIDSWKRLCPDYKIIEWNESNFDIDCHPFVKSAYDAKAWAFVSDYARLKVVLDNGGIYFDTDVELLKRPEFLLENRCFVGIQQGGLLCATGLGFGAEKGNEVIASMLAQYDKLIYREEEKYTMACPHLNNRVLEDMGYVYRNEPVVMNGTMILPPQYMDPLAPGDTQNLLCKDTISIHHYSASWGSKANQWKRKLYRAIGEETVHKIKTLFNRAR